MFVLDLAARARATVAPAHWRTNGCAYRRAKFTNRPGRRVAIPMGPPTIMCGKAWDHAYRIGWRLVMCGRMGKCGKARGSAYLLTKGGIEVWWHYVA